MNRILLIGGTGNVGRHVISQLTGAEGVQIRALVRKPDAGRLPPEVELVQGDLTAPETLDRCLEGIDSVFLVWTPPPATVVPVLERIAAQARRMVYLSAPFKTQHPFFQQPNPGRDFGERVEAMIEASGMEWTFVRPGMFAGNARHFWGPQIRAGNVVRWPYLSAPTAPIDERDIAAIAVRALIEDGYAGKDYVLTGPQSLTQREQIAIIGIAAGRSLVIEEISPDEARREWASAMPAAVANMLLNAWAAAIGQPAFVSPAYQELTGSPPRTFVEWATDHITEFQA